MYTVGIVTFLTMKFWTFLCYEYSIFDVEESFLENALLIFLPSFIFNSVILWIFLAVTFLVMFKTAHAKRELEWFLMNSVLFWSVIVAIFMNQWDDSELFVMNFYNLLTTLNVVIIFGMRKDVFKVFTKKCFYSKNNTMMIGDKKNILHCEYI